jgi:uncharacterized membrane protein YphA (DoxX/SURF4 family)
MRVALTIIRWIVGLLFILSGLVKANDPLGLSYKMQEFFEVWGLRGLDDFTLPLAIIMNTFEILAGVALLIGWQMRLFTKLLLLLIIFFTFLTGYALFSGKIKTCGCFGDCLPLTPYQSFLKDVILLVLIVVLLIFSDRIKAGLTATASVAGLLLCTIAVLALQFFVLRYSPLIDCLPYKKGNDLLREMQPPPHSISDSFAITFKYKKAGKTVEFDQDHFPKDFDSSYEYVDRYDKLIRKGNATPKITDLSLRTLSGTDTLQQVLSTDRYVLMFAGRIEEVNDWARQFEQVKSAATKKKIPLFIVTADPQRAAQLFPTETILTADATVIKTAARVNPTFFLMRRSVVEEKRSYTHVNSILKKLQ